MNEPCADRTTTDEVLVIGWGNDLRGDDAVGRRVAEAIEAWGLPGVRVLAAHQLTPELAPFVAESTVLVLVDAAIGASSVTIEPVLPGRRPAAAHQLGPQDLLALARDVLGRCPPAWLVSVPAESFETLEGLSEAATLGMAQALKQIRALLEE